jgi:hypothetical protein
MLVGIACARVDAIVGDWDTLALKFDDLVDKQHIKAYNAERKEIA